MIPDFQDSKDPNEDQIPIVVTKNLLNLSKQAPQFQT